MNSEFVLDLVETDALSVPLTITEGMVTGMFWLLAAITAVAVLVFVFHLSKYSLSKTKATLIIGTQAAVSGLLLLYAFSAATLFGA